MSYILDALRKLEEHEARPGGTGNRLAGGHRPPGRPPRRTWAYVAAATVLMCAVAFIALPRDGEGDPPVAVVTTVLPNGASEEGSEKVPAEAAKTSVGASIPREKVTSEAVTSVPASGNAAAGSPAAPPAAATAKPEAEAEETGQPPPRKSVAEVPFAEAFSDRAPGAAPEPSAGIIAKDEGEAAVSGDTLRHNGERPGQPVAANTPETGRLYYFEELPAAVKAELGELVITGHIHSEDAGFRVLMIGDGVRKEGETVSPGLVLREITREGAHFTYRGFLFLVEVY